jgi:hypothetical protein
MRNHYAQISKQELLDQSVRYYDIEFGIYLIFQESLKSFPFEIQRMFDFIFTFFDFLDELAF